jgi:predicted tellurium resistance membrane protein TerC
MVDEVTIMILAVILATVTMIAFAAAISAFVNRYPTFKMLALSFLVLIGVVLIAEGLHQHIPKGYIYFAMGFAVLIELVNLRIRKRVK